MGEMGQKPLHLSSEELAIVSELLEVARADLLVEIRHTDRWRYRDELRQRLAIVERLLKRCRPRPDYWGAESAVHAQEHPSGRGQ